jgi:uridine kinase
VSPAERLLSLALSRPPTLGPGRLICIDGPAGAGKTTLAARLTALAPVRVVHMDELYDGWDGLADVHHTLTALLRPLGAGDPGGYRRFDWHAGAFGETVTVPPSPLLVIEGVGSAPQAIAGLVTALAWVEAPQDLRRVRGLTRDGDDFAPHWARWAAAEEAYFDAEQTRGRADLVVATG